MNKTLKMIIFSSIAGLVVAILLPLPDYSIDTYVDINTGDIKEVWRVLSIKVHEEIKQTAFSKLVRNLLGVQKKPEWKMCYGTNYNLFFYSSGSKGRWYSAPYLCNKFVGSNIPEPELKELLQTCLSDMEKNDRASFDNRLRAYLKKEN